MRAAIERGADALAMAGGDGSQAIVASIAAEHDLPYACIPAGTRNHFALDLGVDRDDVVGALDAFIGGGEKRVDLGRRQRPRVRQQRLARAVRRGRPARRLPRSQAADDPRHAARGARPGRRGPRPALDRARWQRTFRRRRDPRLQQPLPARPRGRLGHAPVHRRRPAGDHRRGRAARRRPAACSGRGGNGPRRSSRSAPSARIAAGIDGEALLLESPAAFLDPPARACASGSPASTRARHRRRRLPETMLGTVRAVLAIAAGRRPAGAKGRT